MNRPRATLVWLAAILAWLPVAQAATGRKPADPAAVKRLVSETGAVVSINPATGAARFVRLPAQAQTAAPAALASASSVQETSAAFLTRYGGVFGITSLEAELVKLEEVPDAWGGAHVRYQQYYRGVPVFAGVFKTHFDAQKRLRAVNGTFVPGIDLNPVPTRKQEEAARVALAKVREDRNPSRPLSVRGTGLYVFREGLAQGIPGPNHLAYEVEVGNGADVREFVYVDAHTGKFVDQITGIQDAMFRRAYDGQFLPAVPPAYPASPVWVEGDAFPTGVTEEDNMLIASKETYDLYFNTFGRDSFDGAGAKMDSIFNRGYSCPNASWNGTFISFCNGLTTDDVTAHEWTHAYTQYTHGLIYAWQPGALNEAYSDIFGETVDRTNARMTDTPNDARTAGACSAFTTLPPVVTVNAPPAIAGNKSAGTAAFGAQTFNVTGDLVLVDDGVAPTANGCETPFANAAALAGNIALIDRGVCGFAVKAKFAQDNGAVAVVIANNQGGDAIINMAGADATITIPALSVSQNVGIAIKAQIALANTVNVSLSRGVTGTDASVRWLLGEDDTAVGLTGALRDMWNPTCYSNPGKVSDTQYTCGPIASDQGGVHTNSGVPNHGYALVVDGGTYNAQTLTGIGLVKAAHVYFRAMTVYQVPATDFADHADAIEQSCADLVGQPLTAFDGTPSGQSITGSDCDQVHAAMVAVEMRTPPTQCNFQPLLAQNPPARCPVATALSGLFFDDFETDPTSSWTVSHDASTPADFTARDWAWTSSLPEGRTGSAFFGIDFPGGTCDVGGDESAVLHLDSPTITLPPGATIPLLTFDHWVATEAGFDGGNLKVSVNGGPFTLVAGSDYTYNPYNATLLAPANSSDPLAGQAAFTGSDGGSVSGTWGRSHLNLASYAGPGDTVKLRFDIGNDCASGTFGWYVDDVTLYVCPSTTAPGISIDDVSHPEGNGGTTDFVFTVSLAQPSAQTVTVHYATASGTATSGVDFVGASGTLTFAPLELAKTVTVAVIGDALGEPDEAFTVVLSGATNATIADGTGTGTIQNDEAFSSSVSVGNASVVEGNTGFKNMVFTLTLSEPSASVVTVHYATSNGTALAGSDYTATSGTASFVPGSTTQTFNVPIAGDRLEEQDEYFFVDLSAPQNTTMGDGSGYGIIENDDGSGLPRLSISDASVLEGNVGTTDAVFTVRLSRASSSVVLVKYATAGGTATAPSDYAAASGTLVFPPGVRSLTISVPVNGDATVEPNETFQVRLSSPRNATILDGVGVGTIVNDEP